MHCLLQCIETPRQNIINIVSYQGKSLSVLSPYSHSFHVYILPIVFYSSSNLQLFIATFSHLCSGFKYRSDQILLISNKTANASLYLFLSSKRNGHLRQCNLCIFFLLDQGVCICCLFFSLHFCWEKKCFWRVHFLLSKTEKIFYFFFWISKKKGQ